jgi:deoxyhypusine synthase
MQRKASFLAERVEHLDITQHDVVGLVDALGRTAFQARNVGRAARIYEAMLRDTGCSVILCLAGSLVSAGLRKVIHDLVAHKMVEAIVSTGANIVD